MKTMKRTTRLAAIVTAALLAAGPLAACGDDDSLAPAARGPANVSGQATCVYIEVPAECQDSGVPADRWFQAPATQPAASTSAFHDDGTSTFLMQVWMWHVIYSDWFSSPYYVDRYVPATYRTVYVQHNTTFNNTYHVQETTNRAKATYRTSGGKTVTGDKVPAKRFAPPKNNGGDRNKACNAFTLGLGAQLRGPKPPAPRPPAPRPARPNTNNKGVGGNRGNGGKAQHGC